MIWSSSCINRFSFSFNVDRKQNKMNKRIKKKQQMEHNDLHSVDDDGNVVVVGWLAVRQWRRQRNRQRRWWIWIYTHKIKTNMIINNRNFHTITGWFVFPKRFVRLGSRSSYKTTSVHSTCSICVELIMLQWIQRQRKLTGPIEINDAKTKTKQSKKMGKT